jgi:hypothetical protein
MFGSRWQHQKLLDMFHSKISPAFVVAANSANARQSIIAACVITAFCAEALDNTMARNKKFNINDDDFGSPFTELAIA